MKRIYLVFTLPFLLFGFLMLASCGSSTDPNGGDNGAPSAPANLSGTSGDQEIQLNWAANDEENLSGYNVYRSTESFSDASGMDPINGGSPISSPEYTDTELENGTTYYYRITAVNSNDNESAVSSQLEITPFSNPPDRP
ncbi:MAG: fibronectin type III domain-containing protein [Fodinibius sp.]|nr:fibronectin type III domain-containing protein [Fodinibius sp.]